MEDRRINSVRKDLVIGDLRISFQKRAGDICMQIPLTGMAFYHPEQGREDIRFRIDAPDKEKGQRVKLLWGSEDFALPTFLYQRKDGDYDWITRQRDRSPGLAFRIRRDWREFVLYEDGTRSGGERAFHEFGSLFDYAVLGHHGCVFHGVVMEYQGRGILVMAAAGTGKTTHTRLWRDYRNALILNGDRCLCRCLDGTWYAYGMPWAGSSGEYINRRVPVSCLVHLHQGAENAVRPLSVFDGTMRLLQRVFAPAWRGRMQEKAFSYCEEMAARIPSFDFYCRPDPESVTALEAALRKHNICLWLII